MEFLRFLGLVIGLGLAWFIFHVIIIIIRNQGTARLWTSMTLGLISALAYTLIKHTL